MTPRMSVRARAREIYGEMAEGTAVSQAITPTPDPSPQGGGEKKARATGGEEASGADEGGRPSLAQPDLTAKVRDLYEKSAVPVREIARLVGVTERMIYRYVEKGGWKRRYKCLARDEAVAAGTEAAVLRGRRWQVAPERQGNSATDITPAKGSGGRFIRREDIGKPYPTGLKALDPAGRAKALAVCSKAKKLSRRAQAEARKEARFEVFLEVLAVNTGCFSNLVAFQRRVGPRPSPFQQRVGILLANTVELSIRQVEVLLPDLAAMFRVSRRALRR